MALTRKDVEDVAVPQSPPVISDPPAPPCPEAPDPCPENMKRTVDRDDVRVDVFDNPQADRRQAPAVPTKDDKATVPPAPGQMPNAGDREVTLAPVDHPDTTVSETAPVARPADPAVAEALKVESAAEVVDSSEPAAVETKAPAKDLAAADKAHASAAEEVESRRAEAEEARTAALSSTVETAVADADHERADAPAVETPKDPPAEVR